MELPKNGLLLTGGLRWVSMHANFSGGSLSFRKVAANKAFGVEILQVPQNHQHQF